MQIRAEVGFTFKTEINDTQPLPRTMGLKKGGGGVLVFLFFYGTLDILGRLSKSL